MLAQCLNSSHYPPLFTHHNLVSSRHQAQTALIPLVVFRNSQSTDFTLKSVMNIGNFHSLRLVGWLYCGQAPRQSVWQFYVLPHMRQSWETMTSVSAGHVILTLTQPAGSGRPLRESNPGSPHQVSRAHSLRPHTRVVKKPPLSYWRTRW